jgi:hypothetical protein
MANTAQFGLPLIMPAQAQKHVTINEALTRLDAFAQLRLVSTRLNQPPSEPKLGHSYFVAGKSMGDWAGQAGTIATYTNGGWVFTRPLVGWKAWDEEDSTWKGFDGVDFVSGALTMTPGGAGLAFVADEFDHALSPGAVSSTEYVLPEAAMVVGISGRVLSSVSGEGLTSWRLGVQGADDRYGRGLGTEENSYVLGLTGVPVTYYEATPLILSPDAGTFASGLVRLSVHYLTLLPPRAI